MSVRYPRVDIEFCTKCRWNLRAAWYLQELLSTFGQELGECALQPADGGIFRVHVTVSKGTVPVQIWDRKARNGFPDSKELKQLVRDVIAPGKNLGHSEKAGGLVKGTSLSGAGEAVPAAEGAATGESNGASGTNGTTTDTLKDADADGVCVDCEP